MQKLFTFVIFRSLRVLIAVKVKIDVIRAIITGVQHLMPIDLVAGGSTTSYTPLNAPSPMP